MRRKRKVAWRWFAELLTLNCGLCWIHRNDPPCVQLATAIVAAQPDLDYQEVLYRVALLYDATKGE